MINLNNLIKFSYYFDPLPKTNNKFIILSIILIASAFIGTYLLQNNIKKLNDFKNISKSLKKITGRIRLAIIIALLLMISKLAGMPYFSMRILIILALLYILFNFAKFLYKYKIIAPEQIKHQKSAREKTQYLPRKKRS